MIADEPTQNSDEPEFFATEPVAKLFGTSLNRGDVFRIGPKILSSLPENILLSFRDRASIVSV
jgi:hypothetical protein